MLPKLWCKEGYDKKTGINAVNSAIFIPCENLSIKLGMLKGATVQHTYRYGMCGSSSSCIIRLASSFCSLFLYMRARH